MLSKLKRLTLKEQAEQVIRKMIISNRFNPGTRINVERLAQKLDVSRTPILQALKRFVEEGLVEYQANRGFLITQMTPQMAIDLYAARGMLDGLAGRLAARRIDQKSLNKMKKILSAQKTIVKKKQLLKYSESSFELHSIIYDSCANWLLRELLDYINNRSRPIQADISQILEELYQDHINIVKSLEDRDPDAAEKWSIIHTNRMRELIETENRQTKEVIGISE